MLLYPGVVGYSRGLSSIILDVVVAWTQKPWDNHDDLAFELQKWIQTSREVRHLVTQTLKGWIRFKGVLCCYQGKNGEHVFGQKNTTVAYVQLCC